jgi:hypothetical protein
MAAARANRVQQSKVPKDYVEKELAASEDEKLENKRGET